MRDTLRKLETLANFEVDYELVPLKNAFGENQKRTTVRKDLPLFEVKGIFEEIEIPEDNYYYKKIRKFEPASLGGASKESDFDPTVHLELISEEPDHAEDEEAQETFS